MKAKAAVFMGEKKPFEIREFEITKPPKGYAQMKLIASGICGTDIHMHNGKLAVAAPSIIGHEFIGRISDADPEEAASFGLKIGDNVIADIAVPCGECLLCKSGDGANCVNMKVTNGGSIDEAPYLYGGYTEVNYTPLANLIRIPDSIDPAVAAIFACPGPTAMHAFHLARLAGVDFTKIRSAVVQGLGPVGCFAVMYLHAIGIESVYAITAGNNEEREALAKKLGAKEVLNLTAMGTEAVTQRLQKENGGLGVDLCFEASGAPSAVVQGMDILRNRGVYLVPGQYSNSGGVVIQPQMITFKALHIIGSSQYSMLDVNAYLTFLDEHKQLHDCISKLGTRYHIEEVNQAFADAKSGNNVKTILVSEA
ncbi:MAG: alcohol dehydrogenase catalytic domain-containing protein [Clostridiales bacterium]|mgnify:FL=1|nr:alcohol dehydrogenase catalytic domain-containing protein [Clostridiales bacterium]